MAVRRSSVRLGVFFLFYVIYLILGAAVFSAVEGPNETDEIKELKAARERFLGAYRCVSDEKLEAFVEAVIEAHNKGVSLMGNSSNEPNWSFGQSIFFAASVLTTIGYGHVTPLSEGGKVFCIVYASLGIPLTLIFFTAAVERLMAVTSALLRLLVDRFGHLYRVVYIRLVHLAVVFAFVVVFVFLVPAAVFVAIETNWNYLDSFYYCFISMTTIGLGDYIPGDDPHQSNRMLYKIATTVYLFVGLILMLLMVANVYDVPELNFGHYFSARIDEQTTSADEEHKKLHPTATAGLGEDHQQQQQHRYTETVNRSYQKDSTHFDDARYLTED